MYKLIECTARLRLVKILAMENKRVACELEEFWDNVLQMALERSGLLRIIGYACLFCCKGDDGGQVLGYGALCDSNHDLPVIWYNEYMLGRKLHPEDYWEEIIYDYDEDHPFHMLT